MYKHKYQYAIGARAKVIANTAGHNFSTGSIVYIVKDAADSTWHASASSDGRNAYTCYDDDLEPLPATKEEMESELSTLKDRVFILSAKLDWMNKLGLSEFKEVDFKLFSITEEIKSGKNDKEKMQNIVKIMRKA